MPNSDGTYHTGGFRAQRRFTDPTSGYAGEPPQQRPPAPPVAERTAPPRPPESPVEPAPEPPRETAPEPERDDADPSAVREPSSAGATFGADPGLFTHGRHAGPMPPEWSGTTAPTASAVPPVLAEPAVHAEPTVRPQPALLPEPADPSA